MNIKGMGTAGLPVQKVQLTPNAPVLFWSLSYWVTVWEHMVLLALWTKNFTAIPIHVGNLGNFGRYPPPTHTNTLKYHL